MVIGSLPRPEWVIDLIDQRTRGRVSQAEADRLLDHAVPSVIRMQERAGLDYISDGEWRRENYARVFADKVGGFVREPVQRGRLTLRAVVVRKCPRGRFTGRAPQTPPSTAGAAPWHTSAPYPSTSAPGPP